MVNVCSSNFGVTSYIGESDESREIYSWHADVFSLLFYYRLITEPLSFMSGRIIQVGKMKWPRWPKAVTERSCRHVGISTTSVMGAIIKITTRAILKNSMVSSMLSFFHRLLRETFHLWTLWEILKYSSCLCEVQLKQRSPTNEWYWCWGEISIMKNSTGEFNCLFSIERLLSSLQKQILRRTDITSN